MDIQVIALDVNRQRDGGTPRVREGVEVPKKETAFRTYSKFVLVLDRERMLGFSRAHPAKDVRRRDAGVAGRGRNRVDQGSFKHAADRGGALGPQGNPLLELLAPCRVLGAKRSNECLKPPSIRVAHLAHMVGKEASDPASRTDA
jgi:hypothetical protein